MGQTWLRTGTQIQKEDQSPSWSFKLGFSGPDFGLRKGLEADVLGIQVGLSSLLLHNEPSHVLVV